SAQRTRVSRASPLPPSGERSKAVMVMVIERRCATSRPRTWARCAPRGTPTVERIEAMTMGSVTDNSGKTRSAADARGAHALCDEFPDLAITYTTVEICEKLDHWRSVVARTTGTPVRGALYRLWQT